MTAKERRFRGYPVWAQNDRTSAASRRLWPQDSYPAATVDYALHCTRRMRSGCPILKRLTNGARLENEALMWSELGP